MFFKTDNSNLTMENAMCRTIHCFMRHGNHGHAIRGMADIAALLNQLNGSAPNRDEPKTHAEAIQQAVKEVDLDMRVYEVYRDTLLKQPPEEGAKLVVLEALKPNQPEKVGIVTIATYELTAGGFVVVGTDHLTQEVIQHATPNEHGVQGQIEAVKMEFQKKAQATMEAAEQPKEDEPVS